MEVREANAAYLTQLATPCPPGYKQTEVGVIPEDWDCQSFGKLYIEPSRNGIYKTSEFQGRGTRIVNMGEMFGFEFISDQDMSKVLLTTRELSVSCLQDDDLLFGRRSVVPSGAGKCSLVVSPCESITFESSIIRVRLNNKVTSARFFYYFFASPIGRTTVSTIVSGTNVKGIRATELRGLKVPLPPTKAEQEAIAEALSDADGLIESLEQLITKKRHLKQGAMQDLLTGKKRLPGFSGEWEVKRLGDLCEKITTGKLDANAMKENGEYPFFTCAKEHSWIDKFAFDTAALLVSGNGANVGYVHYYNGKFNAYQRTYVLNGFSSDIRFIKSFMERYLQDRIRVEVNAGNTPYIVMGTLTDMLVTLPDDPKEQTAIAAILSDLDAELAALESKLSKARRIKQGMMQELLTGRIRLV